MNDWHSDDYIKPENNITFKRISSAIGCSAGIASEAWSKLGLDFLDDPKELRDVREAVSIYGSAAKHAQRVYNLLSSLPHAELERLAISQDTIIGDSLESLKELSEELEGLYQHRRSVVKRLRILIALCHHHVDAHQHPALNVLLACPR